MTNLLRNTVLLMLCSFVAEAQTRTATSDAAQFHRDRVADVHHVALDIKVDIKAGTVVGTSTLTMSLIRETASLPLDAAELTVDQIRLGSTLLKYRQRKQQLLVDLPVNAPRVGKPFDLVITYSAKPRQGMFFVRPEKKYPNRPWEAWTQGESEYNRYWFPGYDYPDDRLSSEIKVTVRTPFRAISNGVLKSVKDAQKGWKTYHWKQAEEHVNYLITLVIGDYQRYEIPGHRVPMEVYVHKRDAPHWRRSFGMTKDMMEVFEEYLGVPYPWASYAQVAVDDFMWGGMENTGASTMSSKTLHDERAHLDYSSEGLVAHELIHQWFGNLLTCRNWSHLWLNEGFATFFEQLYFEAKNRMGDALRDRVSMTGWYLHSGYTRPLVQYDYKHPDDLFDGHSYSKGAWVLHMLREKVGHKLFRKGVQEYLKAYRNRSVETSQFRRVMEDATGYQLQGFFNQWVYRAGHPELKLKWSWHSGSRTIKFQVKQENKQAYRVKIPVVIASASGQRNWTLSIDSKVETVSLSADSEPFYVAFDPKASLLADWEINKPVAEWARQLKQSPLLYARVRAAQHLDSVSGRREWRVATKALLSALSDPKEEEWVRESAAESLGQLSVLEYADDSPRDALLLALKNDSSSRVKRAAASGLSGLDDSKVHAALRRSFAKARSYRVVAASLTSYVASGGPKPMGIIDDALDRESHNERIRKAAIGALVQIGTNKAFEWIYELTAWGQPTEVRRRAASALGTLGDRLEGKRTRARKRLLSLLRDPRYHVRSAAISGLKALGDPESIGALKQFLVDEVAHSLKKSAKSAIKWLKSKKREVKSLKATVKRLRDRTKRLESRVKQLENKK